MSFWNLVMEFFGKYMPAQETTELEKEKQNNILAAIILAVTFTFTPWSHFPNMSTQKYF